MNHVVHMHQCESHWYFVILRRHQFAFMLFLFRLLCSLTERLHFPFSESSVLSFCLCILLKLPLFILEIPKEVLLSND